METVPAGPLRTVMSPERVCTSSSTGPVTWNVFSNEPCGVDATASVEASSTTTPITSSKGRLGLEIRDIRCPFIVLAPSVLPPRHSGIRKPKPELLQHDLIAFLQPAKKFRLRT